MLLPLPSVPGAEPGGRHVATPGGLLPSAETCFFFLKSFIFIIFTFFISIKMILCYVLLSIYVFINY